jgi:hypothetical protein
MSTSYKGHIGLYQQRHCLMATHKFIGRAVVDLDDGVSLGSPRQSSALMDLFETARNKVANVGINRHLRGRR